jgi:hypothetical protein
MVSRSVIWVISQWFGRKGRMAAAVYFLTKWQRLIAMVAMFIGVWRFTVIGLQYNETAAIAGIARTAIVPAAGQDVWQAICLQFIGYIFTCTNYQGMISRYVSNTVQLPADSTNAWTCSSTSANTRAAWRDRYGQRATDQIWRTIHRPVWNRQCHPICLPPAAISYTCLKIGL